MHILGCNIWNRACAMTSFLNKVGSKFLYFLSLSLYIYKWKGTAFTNRWQIYLSRLGGFTASFGWPPKKLCFLLLSFWNAIWNTIDMASHDCENVAAYGGRDLAPGVWGTGCIVKFSSSQKPPWYLGSAFNACTQSSSRVIESLGKDGNSKSEWP